MAKEETKQLSKEDIELELKMIELENAKLEKALKEANLIDLKDQLAERQNKREDIGARARGNGEALADNARKEQQAQQRCNHRKGGTGAEAAMLGRGDNSDHALMVHTMPNGDVWIRCLRCGDTAKPASRAMFSTEEDFKKAQDHYNYMKSLNTRNQPSGSGLFMFSDGGEHFRKVTASATLR